MKILEENQFRLVTFASSIVFPTVMALLGIAIFAGPDFATAEIPDSSQTAMRWVGAVMVGLAIWVANSKRAIFDADRQEIVWRQRMILFPFLCKSVEAPFSEIDDVKVIHTGSGNRKTAMIHLVLTSKRELRLTHLTIGRGAAKKLRTRLIDWLNENKKK